MLSLYVLILIISCLPSGLFSFSAIADILVFCRRLVEGMLFLVSLWVFCCVRDQIVAALKWIAILLLNILRFVIDFVENIHQFPGCYVCCRCGASCPAYIGFPSVFCFGGAYRGVDAIFVVPLTCSCSFPLGEVIMFHVFGDTGCSIICHNSDVRVPSFADFFKSPASSVISDLALVVSDVGLSSVSSSVACASAMPVADDVRAAVIVSDDVPRCLPSEPRLTEAPDVKAAFMEPLSASSMHATSGIACVDVGVSAALSASSGPGAASPEVGAVPAVVSLSVGFTDVLAEPFSSTFAAAVVYPVGFVPGFAPAGYLRGSVRAGSRALHRVLHGSMCGIPRIVSHPRGVARTRRACKAFLAASSRGVGRISVSAGVCGLLRDPGYNLLSPGGAGAPAVAAFGCALDFVRGRAGARPRRRAVSSGSMSIARVLRSPAGGISAFERKGLALLRFCRIRHAERAVASAARSRLLSSAAAVVAPFVPSVVSVVSPASDVPMDPVVPSAAASLVLDLPLVAVSTTSVVVEAPPAAACSSVATDVVPVSGTKDVPLPTTDVAVLFASSSVSSKLAGAHVSGPEAVVSSFGGKPVGVSIAVPTNNPNVGTKNKKKGASTGLAVAVSGASSSPPSGETKSAAGPPPLPTSSAGKPPKQNQPAKKPSAAANAANARIAARLATAEASRVPFPLETIIEEEEEDLVVEEEEGSSLVVNPPRPQHKRSGSPLAPAEVDPPPLSREEFLNALGAAAIARDSNPSMPRREIKPLPSRLNRAAGVQ